MAHAGSNAHGAPYLDRSGAHALAEALNRSAAALDETRAPVPDAPDAGVSTALVGDLLVGMSDAIGDLVTAMELAAVTCSTASRASGQQIKAGAQPLNALDRCGVSEKGWGVAQHGTTW